MQKLVIVLSLVSLTVYGHTNSAPALATRSLGDQVPEKVLRHGQVLDYRWSVFRSRQLPTPELILPYYLT